LIPLARTLVELDLAAPEDWESAHRDPGAYVLKTLEAVDHRPRRRRYSTAL